MFESLKAKSFEILYENHSEAILTSDFPDAVVELEEVLGRIEIPVVELITGGGGESQGTQRLRRELTARSWLKRVFVVEKRINDVPRESQSHEIDHVRQFGGDGVPASIALEIEWNNKDPFFDRDLENFKRLHADGAISAGVIVTRGRSLHEGLRDLIEGFLTKNEVGCVEDLEKWGYDPTRRQQGLIEKESKKHGFVKGFTRVFVSDKYGEATTHWKKLEDRVRRGVGNPCPLVLIGIPKNIVKI